MSNLLVPNTYTDKSGIELPITLPNSARKALGLPQGADVKIDRKAAFAKILPRGMKADDRALPSLISSNVASARAGMGGQITAVSFLSGLAWLVASHANGSISSVETVIDGLPMHAQYCVRHSCTLVKRGAGLTRSTLEETCLAGLSAMLGLPATAKAKVTAKPETKTETKTETKAEGKADSNVDVTTGRATAHSLAFGHEAHEDAIRAADMASAYAEVTAQADAAHRTSELRDAAPLYSVAGVSESVGAMLGKLAEDDAITLIRALAARHGFTLVSAMRQTA